jgi:very-short-patch-repair endonuclease
LRDREEVACCIELCDLFCMTTAQRDFARTLRRRQTSAEDLLWQQLRGRRLGLKFRRQVPIAGYVVDFFCFDAKLMIELDGRQHAMEAEYDVRRTAELEAHGLTILRFRNEAVRNNLDGVLACIQQVLRI